MHHKLIRAQLIRARVYAAECVSKIETVLSIIFHSIHGAVCLQLTQFSCDDRENVYLILLSSSNRNYESLTIVYGKVMKQWYALYVLLCSYGFRYRTQPVNSPCGDQTAQSFVTNSPAPWPWQLEIAIAGHMHNYILLHLYTLFDSNVIRILI